MDWSEYASRQLGILNGLAAGIMVKSAKHIRASAAEATELARQQGMLEGQDATPPSDETLKAWTGAFPGPVRCGRAVAPSAHELIFTAGPEIISDINGWITDKVDDDTLVRAAQGIYHYRLDPDGLDELGVCLDLEWRAARQTAQPPVGSPNEADAWLACPDIAARESVDQSRLDQRLRRFRESSVAGRDWREDDPTSQVVRGPRYMYRLGAIRHIIDALKAKAGEGET